MHFARRPQQMMMVAIGEHRSAMSRHPIDGSREPRPDRLHAASERRLIGSLDDEMRVIPLERVVHEPKPRPLAPYRERPLDLAHDRYRPERRHACPHSQRHVRRQRPPEPLAREMSHGGIRPGLPPGTGTRTTPAGPRPQRQCELARSTSHLNRAMFYPNDGKDQAKTSSEDYRDALASGGHGAVPQRRAGKYPSPLRLFRSSAESSRRIRTARDQPSGRS